MLDEPTASLDPDIADKVSQAAAPHPERTTDHHDLHLAQYARPSRRYAIGCCSCIRAALLRRGTPQAGEGQVQPKRRWRMFSSASRVAATCWPRTKRRRDELGAYSRARVALHLPLHPQACPEWPRCFFWPVMDLLVWGFHHRLPPKNWNTSRPPRLHFYWAR